MAMRDLVVRVVRALLPSWRFFDEIDPAPKLYYRACHEAEALPGAWLPLAFRPARSWTGLAFTPDGNLALARHAVLEQLLGDVAEPEVNDASAVEGLTSYALVTQLVCEQLQHSALSPRAASAPRAREDVGDAGVEIRCVPTQVSRFQFKITLSDAELGREVEDVLVSRIHEV